MIPRKGQNLLEMVVQGLENFMVEITGPEGRAFFPYIGTIFLYILVSNLLGLIPGFFSPTANLNTTLSLALCTFVLTHAIGIKFHGAKYIKHFLGPVLVLAPLMFVIEVIGHLARVMSLTDAAFRKHLRQGEDPGHPLRAGGSLPGAAPDPVPGNPGEFYPGGGLHAPLHRLLCRCHGGSALDASTLIA